MTTLWSRIAHRISLNESGFRSRMPTTWSQGRRRISRPNRLRNRNFLGRRAVKTKRHQECLNDIKVAARVFERHQSGRTNHFGIHLKATKNREYEDGTKCPRFSRWTVTAIRCKAKPNRLYGPPSLSSSEAPPWSCRSLPAPLSAHL
jgi:hypothetical protein